MDCLVLHLVLLGGHDFRLVWFLSTQGPQSSPMSTEITLQRLLDQNQHIWENATFPLSGGVGIPCPKGLHCWFNLL